jgi:hypothetical protein
MSTTLLVMSHQGRASMYVARIRYKCCNACSYVVWCVRVCVCVCVCVCAGFLIEPRSEAVQSADQLGSHCNFFASMA